jgi:hypothetical protein
MRGLGDFQRAQMNRTNPSISSISGQLTRERISQITMIASVLNMAAALCWLRQGSIDGIDESGDGKGKAARLI